MGLKSQFAWDKSPRRKPCLKYTGGCLAPAHADTDRGTLSGHAGRQGLGRWHRDAAAVLDIGFLPAEAAFRRMKLSRLVQARRSRPIQGMRNPVCERPLRVRSR